MADVGDTDSGRGGHVVVEVDFLFFSKRKRI
jgi:hypothetical protein